MLELLRLDPSVRACVIRGAGDRAFSAGADITDFGTAPSYLDARDARLRRDLWGVMSRLAMPLIAAIHGFAYGAGLEMSMYCDFRIASDGRAFRAPGGHARLHPLRRRHPDRGAPRPALRGAAPRDHRRADARRRGLRPRSRAAASWPRRSSRTRPAPLRGRLAGARRRRRCARRSARSAMASTCPSRPAWRSSVGSPSLGSLDDDARARS